MNTKFGIVITTYMRKDGKSPFYLKRALDSIFSQQYGDFKIFLIGDKYDNSEEFLQIVSQYDKEKIYFENLNFAAERDHYNDPKIIWNYGGTYASNYGIEKSISHGFSYICRLDHDDWWYDNHLKEINECIIEKNASFVFTKATYGASHVYLPNHTGEKYIKILPEPGQLIHSSVAVDFSKIPCRYENVYERDGLIVHGGDGDLWRRLGKYLNENNLLSYHVSVLTCRHDEEGFGKNNN
jgi:glycosyltransferase involved in cell wall biosynthesis